MSYLFCPSTGLAVCFLPPSVAFAEVVCFNCCLEELPAALGVGDFTPSARPFMAAVDILSGLQSEEGVRRRGGEVGRGGVMSREVRSCVRVVGKPQLWLWAFVCGAAARSSPSARASGSSCRPAIPPPSTRCSRVCAVVATRGGRKGVGGGGGDARGVEDTSGRVRW